MLFQKDILKNRVAIITGGGSGIGFTIAEQLGIYGCNVVIVGRRLNVLNESVKLLNNKNINSFACQGDVRNYKSCINVIEKTLEKYGSIDILINGAAGNFLVPAESLSSNGFKTVMEIDTQGTFNMCIAAFESLKKSKFGGNIVNISANLHYNATWYQIHASAAKAANDSIAKSLALEWGEYNIRVNSVAPGPIADTPGLSKLGGKAISLEQQDEIIGQLVPLGRMGRKDEVANAVIFLVSPTGSYTTGSVIVVDGGQWLHKEPMMDRDTLMHFSRKVEKSSKSNNIVSKL